MEGEGRSLGPVGLHLLIVPVGVFPDKQAGRPHNLGGGAEVVLHLQHLPLGIPVAELQQRLGPRPPEPVDALILVPHQEDPPLAYQLQDPVLQEGGVLGLVHLHPIVPPPHLGQQGGIPLQRGIGVEQHVVKIHQLVLLLVPPVGGPQPFQAGQLGKQAGQFPVGDHPVGGITDGIGQVVQLVVPEGLPQLLPVEARQHPPASFPLPKTRGGSTPLRPA